MRLQAEEDDEKKKKALDELISVRRREGRKFDEQSVRVVLMGLGSAQRWADMLVDANTAFEYVGYGEFSEDGG